MVKKRTAKSKKRYPNDYKKIERELFLSRERFRLVFENAKESILWIDSETNKIIKCNKAAEDLLERSKTEIIGHQQEEFFSPGKKDYYSRKFRKEIKEKRNFEGKVEMITKTGGTRFVYLSASMTSVDGGRIIQSLFHDISKSEEMEEKLKTSERRFREIYENSPMGIALYNPEGKLVTANRSYLDIFGIGFLEEIDKENFTLFKNPFIPEDMKKRLKERKAARYEAKVEFKKVKELQLYKTARLGSVYISGVITSLGLPSDGLRGYLSQVRDVSRRKKIEEEIKKSLSQAEKYSRVLLQSIPVSLIVLDSERDILLVNPTACQVLGHEKNEMVGQPIEKVLGSAIKRTFLYADFEDFIKKGSVKNENIVCRDRDGEIIPLSLSGRIVYDTGKKGKVEKGEDIEYIILIVEDLREERQYARERLAELTPFLGKISTGDFSEKLEIPEERDEFAELFIALNLMVDDLARAQEKREKIDKMKTEFISLTSHQLRTPLSAMKLYSEMLEDEKVGNLNKIQKEYLSNLKISIERLIRIVSDFLNVARLEKGSLKIAPESVELDKFIQEIVCQCEIFSDPKNSKVIFQKPKKELSPILIDVSLIGQVIRNLLHNAVQYSPAGSKIWIKIEEEPEGYTISVKDKGLGIPEEAKSKIFQKFFRAENAKKSVTRGSGIGLYVAKMITEAIGGEIWFESKKGKGSTFYLQIPRKQKEKPETP